MFKDLLKRIRADESQERDASITEWAESLDGVSLIKNANQREVVKVAGVVSRLQVRPRDGVAAYEATISDGTGKVTAIWLGRRTVPGLRLGVRMMIDGRLGADDSGRSQMLNPVYEFEAPAHQD